MSENSVNGHATVEKPVNPPPPSEAITIDDFREIQLLPAQLVMFIELSAQVSAASEAADAAVGIARDKQSQLDKAIGMLIALSGVSGEGYHALLDRQRCVIRLVPPNALPS